MSMVFVSSYSLTRDCTNVREKEQIIAYLSHHEVKNQRCARFLSYSVLPKELRAFFHLIAQRKAKGCDLQPNFLRL